MTHGCFGGESSLVLELQNGMTGGNAASRPQLVDRKGGNGCGGDNSGSNC